MEREEAKLSSLLDQLRFATAREVLALEGIRLDECPLAVAPEPAAAW